MKTSSPSYRQDSPSPSTKGVWVAVLIGASLLYLATCQRRLSWQDSGMFQWRVYHGDYTGDLGLALAHPLYIAMGRLVTLMPVGTFAGRLNFFSGLGMAIALANLAAVVTILTDRRWVGLLSAAMLAVAHTAWWLSTIAEVYTWSVAGLTAELWLLVVFIRRPSWRKLTALAFVSGLGLCLHNFALLPLPVYAGMAVFLVGRRRLRAWSLATALLGWGVGASMYLAMVVDLAVTSGSLEGAIQSALFGRYQTQVLGQGGTWSVIKANAALGAMYFVSFLLPLAVVGWVRMRRKLGGETAAAIWAITLIEILFVVRYPVPDQFTFMLPSLVMIALAAGVGISVLADASRRWRIAAATAAVLSIALPPVIYAAAPSMLEAAGLRVKRERELPFRDEALYWLVPWKQNEDSAQRFAAEALEQAAPDGVILPDSTSKNALTLQQDIYGASPGVKVILPGDELSNLRNDPARLKTALDGRPMYAVTTARGYVPDELLEATRFVRPPGEALYRVRWNPTHSATAPYNLRFAP